MGRRRHDRGEKKRRQQAQPRPSSVISASACEALARDLVERGLAGTHILTGTSGIRHEHRMKDDE